MSRLWVVLLCLAMLVTGTVIGTVGQDLARADGTPHRVLQARQGSPEGVDLATTTITPERLFDSRPGTESLAGEKRKLGPGETRTIAAAGLGATPESARGVIVNITLVRPTERTHLTVFPTGAERPTTSTVNGDVGEVSFNAATVLLGPDGTFDVFNLAGQADVVVDVTGFLTEELSDAVEGLQTGEVLQEINPPDFQTFFDGFLGTGAPEYGTYQPLWNASREVTELRAIEIPEGRYRDAQVRLEALVTQVHPGQSLCFRLFSSIAGVIAGSARCINGNDTPAYIQPDNASPIRWYEYEGPLVPMPESGLLYVEARLTNPSNFCSSDPDKCEANLLRYNFRVFG